MPTLTSCVTSVLVGVMTVALAISGPLAIAQPDSRPPVHLPADPDGLEPPGPMGPEIDPPSEYAPQVACVARALPGTRRLRALTLATYGRGGTSPATPRACLSGGTSEHKDGRAWDWMVSYDNRADRAAAADFLSWLTGPGPSSVRGEMAYRLGVMYVIYNRKIWSSYSPGWRDYTGADDHTSHIHVSLSWNGARAHTSFWTGHVWRTDFGTCRIFAGEPATVPDPRPRRHPCGEEATLVRGSSRTPAGMGSTGRGVARAQHELGIAASSRFGRRTQQAVLDFQRGHDLPRTGVLDSATWGSLMPASQRLYVPDWSRVEALAWSSRAGSPQLRSHAAGKAVYALQLALRLPGSHRNGYFGRLTRRSVIVFKSQHGLPATAEVNGKVWAALRQS